MAASALVGSRASAHEYDTNRERFNPQLVDSGLPYPAGEIHVFPDDFYLYLMQEDGVAMRYGVGVGRDGLYHDGKYTIGDMQEWPRWRPTDAMIARDPGSYARYIDGIPGGVNNPLGARALYLHDENGVDTYLRIHGTNAPSTIGTAVSNGCARLTNEFIVDLYDRVSIGTPVTLHPKAGSAGIAAWHS